MTMKLARKRRLRDRLAVFLAAIAAFGAPLLGPFLESTESSAQTSRPNILVVLTDDQHMYHLKNMPFLSSKPRGKWVRFPRAFLNVPFCCPSRATILTGQYAHHHGINGSNGSKLDDSSTIATWLDGAGYRTGLVGKYLNGYPFRTDVDNYIPPGWDYWASFLDVDHYNYSLNENGKSVFYGSRPKDYSTDVLRRKAMHFLDTTPLNKPFFLLLSTHAPHEPSLPAPRHEGVYEDLPMFYGPNFNEADVSDKPTWVRNLPLRPKGGIDQRQRGASEALLAVDESIKVIMNKLVERGQLKNTIVLFMTDNGFSFGAHRWVEKKCAYEECVRTPLLIRYPARPINRVDKRLVSNVDIAPTIADLAQASPTIRVDGRSLVPLLNNRRRLGWRSSLLLAYQGPVTSGESPNFWAVRTRGWKYVELATGEKELYNLKSDPFELVNVINNLSSASVIPYLRQELNRLKR
jgi:N-acetylglucosamine-6-sulfatase